MPFTRTLKESRPLVEPLVPRLPDLLEEAEPLSEASLPLVLSVEVEEDWPLKEFWSLAPPCALVALCPLRELALPDLL